MGVFGKVISLVALLAMLLLAAGYVDAQHSQQRFNRISGTITKVAFLDPGTRPTCAAAQRGVVWFDAGGVGVADTFAICDKDASNVYAWRTLQ